MAKKEDPFVEMLKYLGVFFSGILAIIGLLLHSLVDMFTRLPPTPQQPPILPQDPATIHQQLLNAIKAANFPNKQDFSNAFFDRMMAQPRLAKLNPSIQHVMLKMAILFYAEERFTDPPSPLTDVITGIKAAQYADRLELMKRRFADPAKTLDLFTRTLLTSFLAFADHLPAIAHTEEEHPLCTVPLVDVIQNFGQAVYDTTLPIQLPPPTSTYFMI